MAKEAASLAGESIEWLLLTTVLTPEVEDAIERVHCYTCRWSCNIKRMPEPIATPPSLAEAVLWIAKLGGFLVRKSDDAPGPHVLWRGLQHLPHISDVFLIMRRNE